jgi:hypothetical protein
MKSPDLSEIILYFGSQKLLQLLGANQNLVETF